MTQQDFEKTIGRMKESYERERERILNELQNLRSNYLQDNELLTFQLHQNKTMYKELREHFVNGFAPAPNLDPNKNVKKQSFRLQRHFSHEIENFCQDNNELTAEGKSVLFEIQDSQVVFTITIKKV